MPFAMGELQFKHPIRELVHARISVRSFAGEPLAGPAREELDRACHMMRRGPFGAECRFVLMDLAEGKRGRTGAAEVSAPSKAPEQPEPYQPRRLGTYGMIRGARTFLAGAVRNSDRALEDFGYLLELLMLKATDLGLGTCWLGGTFNRSAFARALGLKQGELLPAVTPVGVPAERPDLLDRVIRFGAGSARRRPWGELFFDGDRGRALSEARAGSYAEALEAVRLAPSASNRQPWRILREREGGRFHLFLERTPGYRRLAGSDLQRLDMGIAMAHFDLAAAEGGLGGGWTRLHEPPAPAGKPGGPQPEYIATWRPEPVS
jgi:nitroreductase